MSRAALPRALCILQGLVVEAERRGYDVSLLEPNGRGRLRRAAVSNLQLVISVHGEENALRISEEGLPTRAHWNDVMSSPWRRDQLQQKRYDEKATGRLSIELGTGYSRDGRPAKWADRKSWTLDAKLPELLRELEVRAAEAKHQAEQAKREAAERERQWEAAVEEAKERYLPDHRAEVLRNEVARWRKARDIRAYCEALEARGRESGKAGMLEWAGWGLDYGDGIDPLTSSPALPPLPDSVDPKHLQPYLSGWSAYGPDRRW